MRIKVIKVTKNNRVGYIRSASIFGSIGREPIVATPLEAKNYALPCNAADLEKDLKGLHMSPDEIWVTGGTPVDTAHVVEIEVELKEVSSIEGRVPHKDPLR